MNKLKLLVLFTLPFIGVNAYAYQGGNSQVSCTTVGVGVNDQAYCQEVCVLNSSGVYSDCFQVS